jgi:uncharacterized protein (TIGR03000 family)
MLTLLAPNTSSAQFFRPAFGFPGMGYYPVYPYQVGPIGNFPTGTTFYPGLYPRYNYPYNAPLYDALNAALANAPYTAPTNGTATAPYQPRMVEYGTKPAAPQDSTSEAKPTASTRPSSNTPSSTRASGVRPVVREYTVPKEAMTLPPVDQPARIDVEVPARAVVYCDGTKTRLTGTIRHFVTPALGPGREYSYELRAEWKEGERTVSVSKNVAFRAGDQVTVSFLEKPSANEALPEPTTPPR